MNNDTDKMPLTLPVPGGHGQATRANARARARELASLAGRPSSEVEQADYERARVDVTGESDLDRQDAILDALPESKRWDPVPGSEGRQAPESPSEEEDEEGRSDTELLFDYGVEEADRQRVRAAAREAVAPPSEDAP